MDRRIIDLGEYKIEIDFNPETNDLDVSVNDALGDIIESINIADADDDELSKDNDDVEVSGIGFSLN